MLMYLLLNLFICWGVVLNFTLRQKRIEKLAELLVSFLPVMLLFGGFIVFGKAPFFGYITLLDVYFYFFAATLFCYLIFNKVAILRLGRSFRILVGFLIIILYSAFTLIVAINYDDSLFKFTYQLRGIFSIFAMTLIINNEKQLKNFFVVLTCCYVVLLIIGNVEIYSMSYSFDPSPYAFLIKNTFGRSLPYTSFYNTNDFITFLVLFAPFVFYVIYSSFKGATKYICAFLVGVLLFNNILSGRARNSLITSICYILVVLLLTAIIKSLRKHIKNILLIVASFIISYVLLKLTQIENGTLIGKLGSVNKSDHSIGIRTKIMYAGLEMAKDHNFLGVGVGNSVPLIPNYTDLEPINLHNMPLQIFVEYGIIIFAVYLVITVLTAKDLIRLSGIRNDKRMFCVLCFLSLLAYQALGMQPSDAMHLTVLWLIFGILLVTLKIYDCEKESQFFYISKSGKENN